MFDSDDVRPGSYGITRGSASKPLWDDMVPKEIRDAFAEPLQAVAGLRVSPGDRKAALTLFWRIHSIQKNATSEKAIIDELISLESGLFPDYTPDIQEYPTTLFVYLHVGSSAASALIARDKAFTEQSVELLDKLANVWSRHESCMKQQGTKLIIQDPYDRSLVGLAGILFIWCFLLQFGQQKHEDALLSFHRGLEFMSWARLTMQRGYQDETTSEIVHCGSDVGIKVDAQTTVDAFERLCENPASVRDWSALREVFSDIPSLWDDVEEDGYVLMFRGRDYDWIPFWSYAEGLCTSKLSPTEYEKLREKDLEKESERRLKTYFFADCWPGLPEEARLELIMADRLWMSHEKVNLSAIFEHLRLATEHLLRPLIWDRFYDWQRDPGNDTIQLKQLREVRENVVSLRRELEQSHYEPSIREFSRAMRFPSFKRFLDSIELADDDRMWLQNPALLKDLNDLADSAVPRRHPQNDPPVGDRNKVAPFYNRYIGIGCPGILPRLARIVSDLSRGEGRRRTALV